jgi:hypothetical protein
MKIIVKAAAASLLSCLIGCATAQSKPETWAAAPAAAPSRSGNFYIRVIDLPGWAQSPESGPGGFLLLNQAANAQVQIVTFTKAGGEPRDAVGWLMVRLAAQGADIGEMTGIEPGARRPRLTFGVTANGVRINGVAAASRTGLASARFFSCRETAYPGACGILANIRPFV